MVAVLAAAVGIAALKNPSDWWSSGLFTFTLALFLIATVGAFQGRNRAFWLGFALFGWGYMIASYEPWSRFATTPPPLVTTGLLNRLYPYLSKVPPNEVFVSAEGAWTDSRNIRVTTSISASRVTFSRYDMDDFLQVGHFLASWLFAFIGGITASRLFSKPRLLNSVSPDGSSGS
jgi:hypothetical protein